MAYKVVQVVDKFNDKTTVKMNKEYSLSTDFGIISHGAKIGIRHLSKPDRDSLFLDYYYRDSGGIRDFLYLDGGNLIIRINDCENISLPFIAKGERNQSTYTDRDGDTNTTRTEYNYVEIDKNTLEKICSANSIELKMNGRNPQEYSASNCGGLINYCKIFYNGLYNADVFTIEKSAKGGSKEGCMSAMVIGALIFVVIVIVALLYM